MQNNLLSQRELIKKYGITAKKALGQNFLSDNKITAKIADAIDPQPQDLVFEIGPGLGALSEHLAGKAGHFVAIELDKSLVPILHDLFRTYSNTEIIEADALNFDFDAFAKNLGYEKYKIVGNLPYYITTSIIMRILEECHNWDKLVFMMQKEVAIRLSAECGSKDCGAITYAVSYRAFTEKMFPVPPTAFIPSPSVDSLVLKFDKRPSPPIIAVDETLLFRLIKAGFAQRRKTLINSLVNSGMGDKIFWQQAFASCSIDEKRRGETFSLAEYNLLCAKLSETQN